MAFPPLAGSRGAADLGAHAGASSGEAPSPRRGPQLAARRLQRGLPRIQEAVPQLPFQAREDCTETTLQGERPLDGLGHGLIMRVGLRWGVEGVDWWLPSTPLTAGL